MFLVYAVTYNLTFGAMLSLSLVGATGPGGFAAVAWSSMAGFATAGLALLAGTLRAGLDAPLDYARKLKVALGLVAVGFVALSALGEEASGFAAFLTVFGYIYFWQLFNVVWTEMALRAQVSVLPIAAWGLGASAAGVGVGAGVMGALFGTAAGLLSGLVDVNVVCIVACFLMLVMSMLVLDSSTFVDLGGMVDPPREPSSDDLLIARVDALCVRYALTPREREVALMVARGRNARRIQEDLGVSLATVRTHLHHIYEKCGVHSDQELLDLVEASEPL